ncbi:MAG: serpin family protein [Sphingobacteriaceae bacterium]|nr:serpin family protein [Cytophagaceae bacterium]
MRKLLACAFTALAVTSVSCQRETTSPAPGGTPLQLSSARFGAESSAFAFEFFQDVLGKEKADNVLISPLSLHIALGMLLNGAEGPAADELLTALRLKGYSPEQYNEIYRQLSEGLPKVDNQVTVAIANSVWHRQAVPVLPAYIDALKTRFGAEVKPLTADPAPINQWVDEKTRGKITKMFDSLSPDLVLLLLNAVYFKGDWKYQFDQKNTYNAPFKFPDGRKNLIPMMSQENAFRYTFGAEYAAAELPYGSGDYRMTVVLPKEGTDVTAFAKTFGLSAWDDLQGKLREGKLIVKLPRFEFDYEYKPNLNATLQALGIRTVFGGGLTKIRKENDLFVSQVRQKAYIKTDEKGSEAAAVTSIEIELTSAPPTPPTFLADRPFLFFITEKTSNTVLFAGKVAAPQY